LGDWALSDNSASARGKYLHQMKELIMKAIWNGTVIAESQDTVIVEGNHYFPMASVNAALLEPSTHTSVCPWKGTANYYSLKVNDERN
jgi:uncharacterized protein (DUF427 family)